MLRLSEHDRDALIRLPESGMGYQWLSVIPTHDRHAEAGQALVLNSELLVFENELDELRHRSLAETYEEVRDSLESNHQWRFLRPQRQEPMLLQEVAEPEAECRPRRQRFSVHYEGFKRYSAYSRDWRLTRKLVGGRFRALGLVAGSYTTSVNDSRLVPSGHAAVARYALPNPWPAVYVVTIALEPAQVVRLQTGTVQPAFHQAGGGVECLLLDPVDPGTACGPYRIPEV